MAADSKNDVKESTTSTDTEIKKAKKKKGVLSRLWGAIFSLHRDDFEKRLKYIYPRRRLLFFQGLLDVQIAGGE
ncbi:integral membrane metal-binding family protein [Perilla frutescens var. hirtella]|nr:integral membrane metal-binding family protein [Perilla frutescens var. hirtella]KAH6777793.1 integral membrane metal-binding family protein [Perilla frutescens var. frutescens]